jgi:co-chaperonin GroES (HSP10)
MSERGSLIRYNTDYRKIKPTKNNILVTDMDFQERVTASGIILANDDMKSHGIRPRWCRVQAVGPTQEDVQVGEWILVSHGRWTRGLDMTGDDGITVTVRLVDPKDVIMASPDKPHDMTMANTIS